MPLTPQQETAVYDRGGSLLVSAAAGSGKTKVLVERLFSYMEQEGCQVDDFLIITYTKAAAAELRGKIAQELTRRVADRPGDGHLRRQMLRVYQADIKTVDAFCAGLLRENVHLLPPVEEHSLTPDFRVLDEQEAMLLRRRVLDRVLEDFYAHIEEDGNARQLAETLGAGRDDRALEALVLDLHEKTQSHPHPLRWLEQLRQGWEVTPQELADTGCGRYLMEDALRRADFWARRLTRAVEDMADYPAVYKAYGDRFLEVAQGLEALRDKAAGGWDSLAQGVPSFRRMGVAKGEENAACRERAKAVLEQAKKALKDIQAIFSVPEAELLEDLRQMAPAMLALLRLTAQFTLHYQAEKVRRNVMDFSDQEHYAIDLLTDGQGRPTELAKQVSSRYREVMVDEYQDSNQVQNCIFRALSGEERRLFAVGDVKQSIYRFRLAEPGIFLEKYRTFADADTASEGQPRRMVLSRNFRSRREVLDVTNFVFGAIMSAEMGEMDYTDQEKLYFGAEYYPPARRDVELHLVSVEDTEEERFDRVQAEARFAARRIRALLDEGFPVQGEDGQTRPVTPEDIVILMRSPSSRLSAFCAALEREDIPCDGGESEDFFAAMEVAVLLSLLEVVDNPRQDVPLIAVLRSPLVGMTPDRLAQIRALQPDGDYYEALCRDDAPDSAAFLSLLAELRAASREMAADQLLWYIYDRCHASAVFGAMEDGELRLARLHALYDYARRTVQSGKTGLFDFILYLRSLLEKGDAPQLSAASSASGVRIMSVHRSKGLEFPVVVLADLNRTFSRQDMHQPVLVHPQLGAGAERVDTARHIRYDTLSKTALALTLERESKAEEMRILYVALTRAKEKLILVDAMKHGEKHLRELIALSGVPVQPEAVSGAKCPGDWLLLPLLHTTAAGELHQFAELWPQELDEGPEGLTVQLHHVGGEQDAQPADEPAETARGEDVLPDAAALSFRYGHPAATVTPSKVTATQLKGRELDQEIAEGAPPHWHELTPEKPRFMQEAQGLSAAERGTAMHLVMQYLDLSASSGDDVRSQVAALAQRRLLTAEQAASLDIPALVRFLSSPLAERIRRARQVWREYRFALLVDGGIYDPSAAGEELLLQGVADCVFETERGLTVVDFKTDRVTGEALTQRAETYRPQLAAYAAALEKVLEKPVTERILYFFAAGTEISL